MLKGPGNGRESAIRTIHGAGIEVTEIVDVTHCHTMVVVLQKEEECNYCGLDIFSLCYLEIALRREKRHLCIN